MASFLGHRFASWPKQLLCLLLSLVGRACLSGSSLCPAGPSCQRQLDPLWLLPDLVWPGPCVDVCVCRQVRLCATDRCSAECPKVLASGVCAASALDKADLAAVEL